MGRKKWGEGWILGWKPEPSAHHWCPFNKSPRPLPTAGTDVVEGSGQTQTHSVLFASPWSDASYSHFPVFRLIDKLTMMQTCRGILLSYKKNVLLIYTTTPNFKCIVQVKGARLKKSYMLYNPIYMTLQERQMYSTLKKKIRVCQELERDLLISSFLATYGISGPRIRSKPRL